MRLKKMRLLRFLPAANSKILLAFLLITCAGLFAPSGRAEDLHFFKNYFVTGDYAVDGVGLYAKGVNGWVTGTITPQRSPRVRTSSLRFFTGRPWNQPRRPH